MRYVGLVFLGLVLWAGQASADQVSDKLAKRVMTQGLTIGEDYYGTGPSAKRMSRVVYKFELYICMDYLKGLITQQPKTVAPTMDVMIRCWEKD